MDRHYLSIKSIAGLGLLVAALVCPSASRAAILTNHCSFDESSGTTASDSVSSQNSTLMNTARWGSGPYANVSGATSPYTNTPSAVQQFYRARVE